MSVEHFKTCLQWLVKQRNYLDQMTDHWGQDERGCRVAWAFYLDKRNRFLEGVAADFDALCAGMSDDQRLEVLRELKSG